MDRDRFDRLSRLVGAAGTRRDALRALMAGAAAGVVAVAGSGLEATEAKRKSRGRQQKRDRKVRGQLQQPVCPPICTANCSNKPLIGGSNLTKCNLNERDLDGVKLNGANLTKACFGNSSLRGADLRSTNASGACFCGADLTGVNFRGSNITAAQLACADVACNTILPNGKPAVTCEAGQTCCDGECVLTGSDPDNCGACGVTCGACQFCNFGQCEDLADFEFDCNRNPLRVDSPITVCTAGRETGICDGGICNCGPGGVYDANANICQCNANNTDFCADPPFNNCCQIEETCLVDSIFFTTFLCVDC